MKNNQPVTQREVPFPPNTYLVSRTDLKGSITYCNDAFVEISGFTRDELIGQSHNIVRHPDMPKAAFADLWQTVKSGTPWRGLVKNRCKNGDHYWVEAFVVPIKKNGQTTGYMSVRTPPSADRKAAAEALYKASGLDGKLPTTGRRILSLGARLWAAMAALVLMLILVGGLGLSEMSSTDDKLRLMYQQQLQPSNLVNRMMFLLSDNRSQIMLALQHDPGSPFVSMHDHPLDMHIQNTLNNRQEINTLLEELKKIPLSASQQALLAKFSETRERFSREGVNAAREQLKAGQFGAANLTLLQKINPLYGEMRKDGEALITALAKDAEQAYVAAEASYQQARNIDLGLLLAALAIAGIAGTLVSRSVVGSVRTAIGHFERISEGDLTENIDISGRDETGLLLCNLATMQATLKAMLDEISTASRSIDQRCDQLEHQMQQVSAQSFEQQASVESVAAATEEFSQSVQEVALNAQETAGAARASQEQVDRSNQNINQSMAATSRVVDAVHSSNATIEKLNQSIAKIGDMTQVIADIASQTNLLALNAAIEAARAGEQGRGFAVVADEVRKLAERTTTSTGDINSTVAEIQSVTAQAVHSMDLAAREVETGIDKLRASVEGLTDITASSRQVSDMAVHISDAATQQGTASAEVANSMQRVSDLINRNANSAQQAKQAADELLQTAAQLDRLIATFRLYR
ncbi:methyl-accepting chemotaxis protein [Dechloromonas sp. ZY10]|uniref:methyl-accepting chemotaxis protein n=1 Tax=Dechloromonas aquae TaxID=2664436 RepID=UPI003527E676